MKRFDQYITEKIKLDDNRFNEKSIVREISKEKTLLDTYDIASEYLDFDDAEYAIEKALEHFHDNITYNVNRKFGAFLRYIEDDEKLEIKKENLNVEFSDTLDIGSYYIKISYDSENKLITLCDPEERRNKSIFIVRPLTDHGYDILTKFLHGVNNKYYDTLTDFQFYKKFVLDKNNFEEIVI